MREIKFRGIAVYGVDFICGSLLIETNEAGRVEYFIKRDTSKIEVKVETVGQYTGLSDKLGVDIYEGDIFNISGRYFFIEYIEDRARYVLTTGNGYDTRNCMDCDCDVIYRLCVVGNIYENKELLEIEEE